MKFKVISFYKYEEIKNTEFLRDALMQFCKETKIYGRILISKEGINGAVCGKTENIEDLKEVLKFKFEDLTFREQYFSEMAYHKLVVRTREEIVGFGKEVDLKNTGEHVKPEILKKWLDNNEDVVLLDARNDYETKVGKFRDAVTLPIKNFREFPDHINKIEDLKDKKIVMYCTGGIRCEKSSAYLKENGFNNIFQLQGGIIEYANKFKDAHYEGGCFVFDDRLVSIESKPITKCKHCGDECSLYINCYNMGCDRLFICCDKCQKDMKKCCCVLCKKSKRQRKEVAEKLL